MSESPNIFEPHPGKNCSFRARWNGRAILGITRVSPLIRTTEVILERDGSDPSSSRKLPGRTEYDAITLERGITHDTSFEDWARESSQTGNHAFRKEITVELLDDTSRLVLAWKIHRCWVSEYRVIPDCDSDSSRLALEQIRVENEGWERDRNTPVPFDPVYHPKL